MELKKLYNKKIKSMNISKKEKKIAIIGLGYVGLPLAVEFGKHFKVLGFDINSKRVNELRNFIDLTMEVDEIQLKTSTNLIFSDKVDQLTTCNVFIVTVPTPIDKFKAPDLRPLLKATEMLGKVLKKGDIIIYESTVYPGCTEEDCIPILEKESKLTFNKDFFCGYSPERINPGDKINTLSKIVKVTSGSTPEIAKVVDDLYKTIISVGTHMATSIKVAEASKAIENAQRDINISFVNELALIFDKIGIDTNEVLAAASTKWNFLKYKPGLVGGHCIGVDPYYLAHKAESLGYHPQVILSGRRVNDNMSIFVASKVVKLMIQKGLKIKDSKVLVLGVTFKENCPDTRNSKVIDMYNELTQFGLNVEVFDPHANPEDVLKEYNIKMVHKLDKYEAIILAVSHDQFLQINYNELKASENSILYDIKGVLDKNIIDGRL
jgi:UDP-N-acetyl-D-glucosamine/UDP-N-acetyl-D-galactosamine dehydrogenase